MVSHSLMCRFVCNLAGDCVNNNQMDLFCGASCRWTTVRWCKPTRKANALFTQHSTNKYKSKVKKLRELMLWRTKCQCNSQMEMRRRSHFFCTNSAFFSCMNSVMDISNILCLSVMKLFKHKKEALMQSLCILNWIFSLYIWFRFAFATCLSLRLVIQALVLTWRDLIEQINCLDNCLWRVGVTVICFDTQQMIREKIWSTFLLLLWLRLRLRAENDSAHSLVY